MTSIQPSPVVLTIAGTDPSGGAGIQVHVYAGSQLPRSDVLTKADLKTFTSFLCYGTSVVTALVSQNTLGVQDVNPIPPSFIRKQIMSVLEDFEVDAFKTGMLFDEKVVRTVSETLTEFYSKKSLPPLVVDPVCISTSGHELLEPGAVGAMIECLFPIASIITPNLQEAERLLSWNQQPRAIANLDDMFSAAADLVGMGASAVLLKGGHISVSTRELALFLKSRPDVEPYGDGLHSKDIEVLLAAQEVNPGEARLLEDDALVVDVLCYGLTPQWNISVRRRIDTSSTHGTGCTLSAAITCGLARGLGVAQAIQKATEYTHLAIETAPGLGHGNGPLNHMHSLILRSVPLPTSSSPFPFTKSLINLTSGIWREYVEHQFVRQLGEGILPVENFKHFIKQDYIYLKYYARAYGILVSKCTDYATITSAANVILHITRESTMHAKFCESWGITLSELNNTPESAATSAYGGYLLNVGIQGDFVKLTVAFMACLIGYGEVGLWLISQSKIPGTRIYLDGNPYKQWIEDYSGTLYQQSVRDGMNQLETLIAADSPSPFRFAELKEIWETCTTLEKQFWDMAMRLE